MVDVLISLLLGPGSEHGLDAAGVRFEPEAEGVGIDARPAADGAAGIGRQIGLLLFHRRPRNQRYRKSLISSCSPASPVLLHGNRRRLGCKICISSQIAP